MFTRGKRQSYSRDVRKESPFPTGYGMTLEVCVLLRLGLNCGGELGGGFWSTFVFFILHFTCPSLFPPPPPPLLLLLLSASFSFHLPPVSFYLIPL